MKYGEKRIKTMNKTSVSLEITCSGLICMSSESQEERKKQGNISISIYISVSVVSMSVSLNPKYLKNPQKQNHKDHE